MSMMMSGNWSVYPVAANSHAGKTMAGTMADREMNRLDPRTVRDMNARLFFQSGSAKPASKLRPWQYVEMTYRELGLTPPAYIPPLETMEDAEIWMCLDARVNARLRLRETAMAG